MSEPIDGAPVTLFRRVRLADDLADDPAGPLAAVLVSGDRLRWIGPDDAAPQTPAPAQVLDLEGQLMLPAFVDAHVHVTETGLALDGADLSGAHSADEVLAAVARAAATRPGQPVFGHGWDELQLADHRVPGAAELDRAAGGADVYLSRIDVHSALVSASLADRAGLATMDGWDGSGRVERDAHHAARHATRFAIDPARRRHLQTRALAAAAGAGIAEVHECSAPHVAPEQDLQDLLALVSGTGLPRVVPYWAELATSATHARQIRDRVLGDRPEQLAGLAGDLMADGSIGSRTAALHTGYTDAPGQRGHLYLGEEQIAVHVRSCTQAGLQAGFHAIGDRAVSTVVAGFRRAAADLGAGGTRLLRASGHRLEHVEGLDPADLATLHDLGVLASVQPCFDAEWGGEHGMYAHRLGRARTRALNPFAAMHAAGITLAFGSDSPVTPFGPWDAVRAAARHHVPDHRLGARTALAAHLTGPARLRAGAIADLAVWAAPGLESLLPDLLDGAPAPACQLTVRQGRVIHRSVP